jgi:fumarate reductase flavoprotein subunit
MQNVDRDIIVIGAGGCGLMAALVAAKKEARVMLIEKTDNPGGGTAFSSRGIRAAGSRRQRELKIDDSAALYAEDILQRNNGESDAVIIRRLAETSGRVADFLTDEAGIQFQIGEFAFGHSAQRSHSWKEDKTVTDFLFAAVEREKNIEVHFATPVLALEQDAGGVVGVKTRDGIFTAGKIILASGGFGASAELLSKYIPKAVGIPFPGHHGSTGDGIKMGLEIGAAIENMGAFQPYPAYIGPGKRAVAPEVALSGGIMVDAAGRRFVDETRYPGGLGIKMLDLDGKQAYEIFDEGIFQLHRNAPGLRSLGGLFDAELLLKAETPEELAGKLGVDAEGLKQTIRDCNQRAARGDKDPFGRVLPQPLAPLYYGIKVTVALYHTQGGLKVNADGQVLRADGSIIPNLYAGGGVAVGVSGKGLEGYLPGNGLLASLGLGMIAAEHAVASLKANY